MNQAAAASEVLQDIANSQVIMTEVVIYGIASILILLLMDFYAAKKLGKLTMEYKVLRMPKYVSLFIICGFTVVIGVLCMYKTDFSVTRQTLTYFGIPYFIGLVYYLVKMLRRVQSETKRRRL